MHGDKRLLSGHCSHHDYLFASYFEVKKAEHDILMFHSLSVINTTHEIAYEKAGTFADLNNNPIISAFDELLNEIYSIEL